MQIEQSKFLHRASKNISFTHSYANWNTHEGFFQMLTTFPSSSLRVQLNCTASSLSHLKCSSFSFFSNLNQNSGKHLNVNDYKYNQCTAVDANPDPILKLLPNNSCMTPSVSCPVGCRGALSTGAAKRLALYWV